MSILSRPQPCKWITLRGASWIGHSYLTSLIPLAIIGAKSFYTVLVAILSKSFLIYCSEILMAAYVPHIPNSWHYKFTTRSFISVLFIVQLTYHNPSPKPDVIGYWSTIFAAIVLTEHFLFRKNNFDSYRIQDWDKPSKLPIGIAALLSFLGGFGMVIPSMSQVWYTGPIAKAGTGDIGVLTGAVVSTILYAILRALEKKAFLGRW